MFVIVFIVPTIIITALTLALYQKTTNAICLSRRRLDGKTVIVTGGTAGMGLHIATDLAHRGARVIVACPFEDEGTNARKQIVEETGNENVVYKYLDLGSLQSVRQFAADILKTEDRLDVLLNNAGVGMPWNLLTSDGMNFVMQVNYYGTFLLTLLLIPLLKKTGKPGEASRIINTASVLHRIAKMEMENLNRINYWNYKLRIYGNSKLCIVLFTHELSERLNGSNVVVNSVDPGFVGTRIFDALNIVIGFILTSISTLFFKTPWEGAQTALYAALDEKSGEVSGTYFMNCRRYRASKQAHCSKTAKVLWEESVKLVKLTEDELGQCFKSLP
ncbi:retinol dehydrogenase 11-like isoform X2 [Spodoptera frugiperda]|uniref:Retinol dehydrogenase 11-like isoform X2 n=1 Tax=Spodoptera frugiperda TaxID=7108 RepID=A0A9R0E266_SPOFR|nr:retinol dehydrogenase 11-like isoform X2 [Spodoptera frugiperda]